MKELLLALTVFVTSTAPSMAQTAESSLIEQLKRCDELGLKQCDVILDLGPHGTPVDAKPQPEPVRVPKQQCETLEGGVRTCWI